MPDPFGRDIPTRLERPRLYGRPDRTFSDEIVLPPEYPVDMVAVPLNDSSVEQVLRSFLNEEEPRLARILFRTWSNQFNAIRFQDIREAIASGEIPRNLIDDWQQEYAAFVNGPLSQRLERAVRSGSEYMSNEISAAIGQEFRITETGQRMRNWIDSRSAEFLTNVTEQQRSAVRTLIRHFGVDEPIPPAELARYLRPVIRLTRHDTNAVIRFRDQLLRSDPNISRERLIRMTENYSGYLWRKRAMGVARTELAFGHNFGQFESVRTAVEEQRIANPVVKQWWTAEDERVCPFCAALHGKSIGIQETFPGATQMLPNTFTPPGHPLCRCTIIWAMAARERQQPEQRPIVIESDRTDIPSFPPEPTSFGLGDFAGIRVEDDVLPVWNEYIRDNPKQFIDRFFGSIPLSNPVIKVSRIGTRELKIDLDDDSVKVTRKIDFNSHSVEHTYFQVDDDLQSRGVAKKFLSQSYQEYKRIGINHIELTANIDIGGYAWAKYGFVPSHYSWIAVRDRAKARFQDLIELNLFPYPESDRINILNLFRSDRPNDIWKLSDLGQEVENPLTNERQKLGKYLLIDSLWEGHFLMNDALQVERFERYVGLR